MSDSRCCGSGACIINLDGVCWCGQKWDATKLLKPEPTEDKPNNATNLNTPVKINPSGS